MQTNLAKHLTKEKKIQLGSYYTPAELVNLVHKSIEPYLNEKNVILFDSAGGYGAFLLRLKHYNYRIADYDLGAYNFLKQHFTQNNIFYTNSLKDVNREKYFIPDSTFLIMIGNPPYNDTTSEFKNGKKGENICDRDLFDRDLGISFLKSYDKLKADVVCVLHPLSYLAKEANFKRLKSFKDNYKLIKGVIFSSALFLGTGNMKFPILVGLYERNHSGMSFEYIKQFQFDVLNSDKKFVLSRYQTVDGWINKYPPSKKDMKDSPIGLYYYTFRDLNSLKKNASFITKKHSNGIIVTLENFYKYSYLYSLKTLFVPKDAWLYGNLSPLANIEDVENNKKLYVLYALKTNKTLKEVDNNTLKKIIDYYKINLKHCDIDKIEEIIKNKLNKLVE